MAGPIGYYQTGTLSAYNTSLFVTLDHSLPSTSYVVNAEVPFQTSHWITSKTTSGFTFWVGTSSAYNQTIPFWIFHE